MSDYRDNDNCRDDDRDDDDHEDDHDEGHSSGGHGSRAGVTIIGTSRNETIKGTSRDDTLDGGAGSDRLDAGAGNDLLIYRVSQNVGARDWYDGGSGRDTLRLEFTGAQWARADVQADVARFQAALLRGSYNDDRCGGDDDDDWFSFRTFGLNVRRVEVLEIRVDGVVLNGNDRPVTAVNDTAQVAEDGTVSGNVLTNDSVPDGLQSVQLLTSPAHGSLVFNADGTYSYVPGAFFNSLAQGQTATESFTYKVTDRDGDTGTATVTFTITGTNDGPVAVADTAAGTENQALVINVLANDSDPDAGAVLRVTAASVAPGNGTVTVNADNTISFAPGTAFDHLAAGVTASVAVSYTVSDQFGATATQVLTITVTGTNDAPVITSSAAAATGAVQEDGLTTSVSGQLAATDVDDGATRSWSIFGAAAGTYGTIAVDASGKWTYSLDNASAAVQALGAGQTRTDSFTVRVTDDKGATADQVVTVTVSGANDGAVITGSRTANLIETNAALSASGQLLASDIDSAATFVAQAATAGNNGYGSFSIDAAGNWTYAMNSAHNEFVAGQTYTDSFTAATADGTTQLVTVTIAGTNDAAVITGTGAATLSETNAILNAFGTLAVTDVDSPATFVAQTAVSGSNGYGKFSLTAAGNWTYTTNTAHDEFVAGQTYTDSFTALTADGTSKTVTVSILGTDDKAVIGGVSTANLTEANAPLSTGGALTATDVDSTPSFVVRTGVSGAYGSFNIDAAGNWTYTMGSAHDEFVSGQTYTDSFTASTTDGVSQVVTVTITGTNDAPVINSGSSAAQGAVTEDTSLSATGQLTAFDPDLGATRSWSIVGGTAGVYGSIGVSSTGKWTYNLANSSAVVQALAAGDLKTENFTVRVTDNVGATADQLVQVFVSGKDDPSVITGTNTRSLTETNAVLSTGAKLTVTDIDGPAGFVVSSGVAGSNGYGRFSIDAVGNWTYTTNSAHDEFSAGHTYTDSFTATALDGVANTVTVTIFGSNDAPVIVSAVDSGSVTELPNKAPLENVLVHTVNGSVTFSDPDLLDGHVAIVLPRGGGYLGTLALTQPAPGGHTVGWNFSVGDGVLDSLAEGEIRSQVYDITISDGNGGLATQQVTITITGAADNSAPVAVGEALDYGSGVVSFEDGSFSSDDQGTYTEVLSSNFRFFNATAAGYSDTVQGYIEAGGPFVYAALGVDNSSSMYSYGIRTSGTAPVSNMVTSVMPMEMVRDGGQAFNLDAANITAYVDPSSSPADRTLTAVVTGYLNGIQVARESFMLASINLDDSGSFANNLDLTNPGFASVDRVEFSMQSASDFGSMGKWTDALYLYVDDIRLTPLRNILANDTDVDPGTVLVVDSYDAVTALGAAVQVAPDGTVTYDPSQSAGYRELAAGERGEDSFTYAVRDDEGAVSNRATATLSIFGVNDAATISGDMSGAVAEDTILSATGQVLVDDPDHGESYAQLVSTDGLFYGAVSLAADGTWTYSLDNNLAQGLAFGESVTESFVVGSIDGTAQQTVSITIEGVNDRPVAVADVLGPVTLDNELPNYEYRYIPETSSLRLSERGYVLESGIDATQYQNGLGYGVWVNTFRGSDLSTAAYSRGDTTSVLRQENGDTSDSVVSTLPVVLRREDGNMFSLHSLNLTGDSYIKYHPASGGTDEAHGEITATITGFLNGVQVAQESVLVPLFFETPNLDNLVTLQAPGFDAVDEVTFVSSQAWIGGAPVDLVEAYVEQYLDDIYILPPKANQVQDINVRYNDSDVDHGASISVASFDAFSQSGAKLSLNPDGTLHYDPTTSVILRALAEGQIGSDSFSYSVVDEWGEVSDPVTVLITLRGVDDLNGGPGNDILNGTPGSDSIFGNDGNDTINGQGGADTLIGGNGSDRFVLDQLAGAGTSIADFNLGAGDILDLSALMTAFGAPHDANAFADGFVQFQLSGSDTLVLVDEDGGGDNWELLATLSNTVLQPEHTVNYLL